MFRRQIRLTHKVVEVPLIACCDPIKKECDCHGKYKYSSSRNNPGSSNARAARSVVVSIPFKIMYVRMTTIGTEYWHTVYQMRCLVSLEQSKCNKYQDI